MKVHLSEEPVELHALGCSVAALDEAQPAVHIHQALVVVVIDGGTEEPDVKLLSTGVVHRLQETHIPQSATGVTCRSHSRAGMADIWGMTLTEMRTCR